MFLPYRISRSSKWSIGLLVILFFALETQNIFAQVNVFDLRGDWRVSGNGLKKGQQLKENDVIVNSSRDKNDFIIIKSRGETLASRFCNRADCSTKLVVRKVSGSNSYFSVLEFSNESLEQLAEICCQHCARGIVR